ncbi:hypothetical protein [Nocardia sp. NPDC050710]|uniref:hypothetical protein n=1 Tax=Nocardia sp. NPDC050710 TaxID=3157220 RepID=UPI0033F79790
MADTPQFIDGAHVLAAANILRIEPTGKTRHYVGRRIVDDFAGLAIARYDADPGVYLFYCDAEWNAITDSYHEELGGAYEQAEFEFGPVEFIEPPHT